MLTAHILHRTSLFCLLVLVSSRSLAQTAMFDYKRYVTGTPATLSLNFPTTNTATGAVTINGGDTRPLAAPFQWTWGDGSVTNGYFPQSHTYADRGRNYVVKVTSSYAGGGKDSLDVAVWFVPPAITPITIPAALAVTIPETVPGITTRLYTPPAWMTAYTKSMVSDAVRPAYSYVLRLGAMIEYELVNGDVYNANGSYAQVVLRDTTVASGGYAMWCTNPMLVCLGDRARYQFEYATCFTGMGFNFALNSPAKYYYGGRIDGNANAIFTETVGEILSVSAGYEIINNYKAYGLPPEVMVNITSSMAGSVMYYRSLYDRYLAGGKKFSSWNNPASDTDETMGTFTALTFKFLEKAESSGQGYKAPVRRLFKLLQGFNPEWEQRYDRTRNTPAADTFRATLMTAALSYAFQSDMRGEFRSLNFPISDRIYNELYGSATSVAREEYPAVPVVSGLRQNYPNPFNPTTSISFTVASTSFVTLAVFDVTGRAVASIVSEELPAGTYVRRWNAEGCASGLYFYRLKAENYTETKMLQLLK